jgi:Arc/MetJ family transcription regulator
MRTNIDINDEVMNQASSVSTLKTKGEIVEQALKEFVRNRTRKDLAELRGKIKFVEDYDYKVAREFQK